MDANRDGILARSEVPEDKQALFQRLLASAGKGSGGELTRDEFLAALQTRRPRRAADEKLPAEFGGLPGPEMIDQIFRHLDRNQDGKVIADEIPDEARGRFDRLAIMADRDGDGAISREEVDQALVKIREQFNGKGGQFEPEQVMEYLDRNADGKLSPDEVPNERREMFERGVRFGDRDGDGALDLEELRRIMQWRKAQLAAQAAFGSSTSDTAPGTDAKPAATKRGGKNKNKNKKAAGQRGGGRLARLDADHDGKLSPDEFAQEGKKALCAVGQEPRRLFGSRRNRAGR